MVNIKTNRGKGLALNQTRIRIRNEFGVNGLQRKIGLSKSHYFRIHEGADITDANEIKVTDGNFIDPRQPGQRVPHRYTNSYETPDQGSAIFFSDKPYKWIGTGDIVLDANGVPVMDASTGQPAGMQLLPGGQTFNHMDRFFDAGNFITNSVSISRNMRDTNFSLTFGSYIQDGVIQGLNGFDRKNVRLSLDHKFRETLSISLSGYISSTDRDDIAGGPGSPFFGLTFMGGDADLAARHNTTEATVEFPDGVPQDAQGQLFIQPDGNADRSNPLYALEANQRQNKRDRVMGSISLNYAPANWAKFEGSFSYDKSNRDFSRFWPVGYQSISASVLNDGRFNKEPSSDEALNGSVTAFFQKEFFNELTVRTKARALFERADFQDTFAQGTDLSVRGVEDLSVANQDKLVINSSFETVRSEGYSVITSLDYKDRYITDFLIRRDGSSLFGPDQRWHTAHFDADMNKMVPEHDLFWMRRAMPLIRMRIPSHQKYSRSSVQEIIGPKLKQGRNLKANTLAHMVFLNRGDRFEAVTLPAEAQFSPAFYVGVADFDGDGHEDIFLSQNFFASHVLTPRSDAGWGLWLRGDGTGRLAPVPGVRNRELRSTESNEGRR